jgi:hypothetical protein
MIKVKCFSCNMMGHYVGKCPNRKKNKQGGITIVIPQGCALVVLCIVNMFCRLVSRVIIS